MSSIIDQAKEMIVKEHYQHIGDTTTIVCALETKCGFVVSGKSACLNPMDFDESYGRQYAYEDALNKLIECVAFFIKYTEPLANIALKLLDQNPEFFKMDKTQQQQVIQTLLNAAADPAQGDERGHFLNAANALTAQIEAE